MKKLIALATVVAFCFFASPTLSAQSETETLAVSTETSVPTKSLTDLESDLKKAEKKLTSLEREMKYIETLKGNKKYKKEVTANYEAAKLAFYNADVAYQDKASASTFKALELPPANATADTEDEDEE